MTGNSLLPGNATPWETAVSLVSDARRGLDTDVIARVRDPRLAPAVVLPILAHMVGCDVWDPRWPEDKQRRVVADQIRLHRLKGTLAGLEGYAKLVDSEIVRVIAAPGTFFLSGGLTAAQRARLSILMPQIRLYKFSTRSKSRHQLFLARGRFGILGAGRVLANSGAEKRRQPQIMFAENNIETPVSVEQVLGTLPGIGRVLYERALLRRKRKPGVFYCGQPLRYLCKADFAKSMISYLRKPGASSLVKFGLKPASVEPELFFAKGKSGRAFLCGKPLNNRFLGGLDPDARVYERMIVWDPDLVPKRRGASHFGVSRFGVASYTAEIMVHIPGKRHGKSFAVGPGGFFGRGRFFIESDGEKYRATMRALRAGKAARDRILVNTKTFRTRPAGTQIVAGTAFTAGKLLRSNSADA